MSTTTKIAESVSYDLSSEKDESSVAEAHSRSERGASAYVSNSVKFHLRADSEDREIWFSITSHAYTALEDCDEPFVAHAELMSHRFTEVQARALLATLVHELAKLD